MMRNRLASQVAIAYLLRILLVASAVAVHRASAPSQCGVNVAQEQIITDFLGSKDDQKFLIQGWRWHTMSLAREANRLHLLARSIETSSKRDESSLSNLEKAADYVVGFNMKGLHKIESDLFFPWVRKMTNKIADSGVAKAFGAVVDKLESDQRKMEDLGVSLVSCCVLKKAIDHLFGVPDKELILSFI